MKKLVIACIMASAAFLTAVDHQLTNNKGSEVTVTIKNAVPNNNNNNAQNAAAQSRYQAGDTIAGPLTIAAGQTIDLSLPFEDNNPQIPTWYYANIAWHDNEHNNHENEQLFFTYEIPFQYLIRDDGVLRLSDESAEAISALFEADEQLPEEDEQEVPASPAA